VRIELVVRSDKARPDALRAVTIGVSRGCAHTTDVASVKRSDVAVGGWFTGQR
jgi:hypothetical protein